MQLINFLLPLIVVTVVLSVFLGALHYFLIHRHESLSGEELIPRQLLMLGLTLVGAIVVIIVAPLEESTRNQILALLGIAISAVIAFSSTSFVANFMAAAALRVTQPFRVGDFITVGDYFGKVVSRGLLDTEIQTETRELIAIPNTRLTSQPVVVTRRSGVIITTSVSLGYDLAHNVVEPLLIAAAGEAGLNEPYVHITELGDFSVTYKLCGLLEDVERVLTVRSDLRHKVLDALHGAGLEIVSPNVVRHITQGSEDKLVPESVVVPAKEGAVEAEEIAFDKARAIEQIEAEREQVSGQLESLKSKSGDEAERLQSRLDALKAQEQQLREDS